MQKEDSELVERSLSGDQKAFLQLFEKYKSLVGGIAFANLHNKQQLDDAIQETFTRAWANLEKLKEPSKFSSWLHGITRWVCMEMKRDNPHKTIGDNPIETKKAGNPDILEAVWKLPLEYREAIILFYIEERSYKEIAELLNVSAATINFRLTQARKMLRDLLKT